MERKLSGMKDDFVASSMRSLAQTFQGVLGNMENVGRVDYHYVSESLKRAETHIRNLRKFLNN